MLRKPRSRSLKNAARVQKIVRVLVKHGFQDVVERIKLLNSFGPAPADASLSRLSVGERARAACEELGPTFVKLGQLLAGRPDLIPEDIANELAHLHSEVKPMKLADVKSVIRSALDGEPEDIFAEFDEEPLGSASIAQVHRAKLKSGETVVVKVQRPGIEKIIENDIGVLYFIAELVENYIAESKAYNPTGIVEEFDRTLQLETNFVVEANNIRKFHKNFEKVEEIVIPQVYWELTSERVLVMEYLDGTPLSTIGDDRRFDPEEVVRKGLRAYFKMIFEDRLFHGDLHAGNFMIMSDDRIGLVDFGVVGRLSTRTQRTIANMLIALSTEDYERLALEYLDIAPFNENTDPDKYARELSDLTAPYFGLSLKDVNIGQILMSSARISAENSVHVPTELMLYFRSVVAIEGLGRKIIKDFDFLELAIEMANDLAGDLYAPQKLTELSTVMARDTASFLTDLPRQMRLLLRRTSAPGFAFQHRIDKTDEVVRSIEHFSHLLFLSVVIGSLLIGSSIIIAADVSPKWLGVPLLGLIGLAISGVLSLVSVYQYVKKS